jgi:hypothetical protein
MLKLEVQTKLSHQEAIERLKSFFGKGGLGLEIKDEASQCLTFEGGGGFVTATVCPGEGNTRIDLETQEWEYQVKKFSSSLP